MLLRGWLLRVLAGVALVFLGCVLALIAAERVHRRSGPPQSITVDEAADHHMTFLDHVRLTAILRCGGPHVTADQIYARVVGDRGSEGPLVLVAIAPDEECTDSTDGPAEFIGSLESPRALWRDSHYLPRLVAILRPHPSERGGLAVDAALVILGGLLVHLGLRRRRRERELLRAEPPPVDLTADALPADPYRQIGDGRWLLPGPLRLDPAWVRDQRRLVVLLGLAAAAALAGTVAYSGAFAVRAVREASLLTSGVEAHPHDIWGHQQQHLAVIDHTTLLVAYDDDRGVPHHGSASRLAIGLPLAYRRNDRIRYDPADPSRFAVVSMVDDRLDEVLFHLLLLLLVVPACLALLVLPRRGLRELVTIRDTLHNDPEEVVLDVLLVQRDEVRGQHISTTYDLRLPGGAPLRIVFSPDQRPLFLELDESRVLGLRRRGAATAVVLRDNLAPLLVEPREPERVRLRWRRGKPT